MDDAKMEAAIHPSSDPPLLTWSDDGQTNGPEKNPAKGALSKSARKRVKRKKKKQVQDERDKGHDEAAAENETTAQEAAAAEDERIAQEAEAADDDRRAQEAEAEAAKYEKRTREAESGRAMAIRELGGAASAIDGLTRSVEAAQAEEARAREEAEFAVLRLRETEQSTGPSADLEDVRRRHASTMEDLRSARAELESLRTEREAVVARAREAGAATEELAAELAALKGEVDASRAAHEAAEEKRMKMTWALKEEKARWLAELEGREDEVRKLEDEVAEARDVESQVAAASEQLASLKAELFTRAVEGTLEGKPALISPAALEKTRKELEEVKASVNKAKDEAKILRVAAASLRADLDREKAELAALRGLALSSASVPALEEELSRVTAELAVAEARAKQSTTTTPEQLSEARQEVERAKESARAAREEVAKARDEARLAKAAVDTMELRLEAVMRETLAADASAEIAAASADALQAEGGGGGVTLAAEEYGRLSARAREAEELAGKRVTEAVRLVEEARDAEARSLDNLAQLAAEADRRKRALQAATAQAEDAELGKLSAEMELRRWRADHRQLSGASSSSALPRGLAEIAMFVDDASGGDKNPHVLSPRAGYVRRADAAVGREEEEDGKERKAFFFPRMVMFLARRKAHTHNLRI